MDAGTEQVTRDPGQRGRDPVHVEGALRSVAEGLEDNGDGGLYVEQVLLLAPHGLHVLRKLEVAFRRAGVDHGPWEAGVLGELRAEYKHLRWW